MAHVAPVLVDNLHLTRGDFDAGDAGQRLLVKILPEAGVGERDAGPLLRNLLHQLGADVSAVRGRVGPALERAGGNLSTHLHHHLLGERVQIHSQQTAALPEVDRIVDFADTTDDAGAVVQVGHLGDGVRVQVIAEEIGAVLPVRAEDERAVAVEPAGVGEVEVVRMAQIVGQSSNLSTAVLVSVGEWRILKNPSFAHSCRSFWCRG